MIGRGGRQGERHGRQAVALRRSRSAAGGVVHRERRARGFTLIEMLVVMIIIGILASLALGVMYAATERARHSRTESLIRKLHIEVMQRIESYETRRLPIDITHDPALGRRPVLSDFPTTEAANYQAYLDDEMNIMGLRALRAQRELMRMELPDRYADFAFDPTNLRVGGSPVFPPLWNAYRRRIAALIRAHSPSIDISTPEALLSEMLDRLSVENQSAEMLYLIISTPVDGSGKADFSDKYVGDTDGDGIPEFVDAWGNPIEWFRWPAGYLNVNAVGVNADWGYVTDLHAARWDAGLDNTLGTADDFLADPDPFDTRQQRPVPDSRPDEVSPIPPGLLYGYRIVPLIASPGPDGISGITSGRSLPEPVSEPDLNELFSAYSDPYYFWAEPESSENYIRRGMPRKYDYGTDSLGDVGEWVHFDNITNHLLEVR